MVRCVVVTVSWVNVPNPARYAVLRSPLPVLVTSVQERLMISMGSNIIMSSKNAVTIGSLIEKDLKEAYFLPQGPSSYCKGYRLLNDKEYQLFDYPPCPLDSLRFLLPFRHLPAAGNEIPIIMECKPEFY